MSEKTPYILLDDQITHQQRYYADPIDIIEVHDPEHISDAFERLSAYHAQGYYLAGYVSYDLGFALEPKLAPLMPKQRCTPLMQFGVFKSISDTPPASCLYTSEGLDISLKAHWPEAEYKKRFEKVMSYIRTGDVYQINLTFPMNGHYVGTADQLYAAFRHRQKGRYGGIVSLGSGPEIVSLSPELFFRKNGQQMSMRPMKGTRPRAALEKDDEAIREEMRTDVKSQAENLMIVDLLRNDLSRISEVGSVSVPELFALETYPTLHQMTSRITSKLENETSFENIFKSLFPCGSVTGAPKIRAMEIISELEDTSRGAYCGGIGYIDPDGDTCFNVAIRTLTLSEGKLRYNVGSGLVLDSGAADEYAECLLKADVLKGENLSLIETLIWSPKKGYIRGDRHLARLKKSANDLGFSAKKLKGFLSPNAAIDQHVRLSLSRKGELSMRCEDYHPLTSLKLSISKYPLSPSVQHTSDKITRRAFYDGERERIKNLTGADEVIFLNAENQLCEGSFTSLFIKLKRQLCTPPLNAGILPGILRGELVETGRAIERHLSLNDLRKADDIYMGNSLRGLIKAEIISYEPC